MLRDLRDEHPIVPVIEEWRELTKLLNTYLVPLPALLDPADGRLHTTFNQAVAATGRLSTTNPNLQSIPVRTDLGAQIRSAFVAEEGRRLLSADYSQVELRILAHVSGEPVLREAFARGEDIHAATAAEVLGKDRASLTRQERDVAKMVNFGIIYGISAFGLSENLDIPRDEAQTYIDTYLARFPRVQELHRAHDRAGRRADGYVTTLLGRRRPIPELARVEPADPLARRAAGGQHRDAGHRRRRDQGGDGRGSATACCARGARLGSCSRSTTSSCSRLPDVETSAVRELVREEMVGAYPLDPPLAVDVGVGDTGATRRAETRRRHRRAACRDSDARRPCFRRRVAILRDPHDPRRKRIHATRDPRRRAGRLDHRSGR